MPNKTTIRADAANAGGRPTREYLETVGTTPSGSFLHIDRLFRDASRRLMAAATCTLCGKQTQCRLVDILTGHTRSCKCLRPKQYVINVSTLANQIPWSRLGRIWCAHLAGRGRCALAKTFHYAVIVIDIALRRYQRWVDEIRAALKNEPDDMPKEHRGLSIPQKVIDFLRRASIRFQNRGQKDREQILEVNRRRETQAHLDNQEAIQNHLFQIECLKAELDAPVMAWGCDSSGRRVPLRRQHPVLNGTELARHRDGYQSGTLARTVEWALDVDCAALEPAQRASVLFLRTVYFDTILYRKGLRRRFFQQSQSQSQTPALATA